MSISNMFHLEFSIIFILSNEASLNPKTISHLSPRDSHATNQLPKRSNHQPLPHRQIHLISILIP